VRSVLITAGATRNPIDAMRFISAYSSGRTGALLAEQLAGTLPVHLLGSPEALLRAPEACTTEEYSSTDDLMVRMRAWVSSNPAGVVVHAAAVGDYQVDPGTPLAATKIPSGQPTLSLHLVPTPKILDQIRQWSDQVQLISFKAAPPLTEAEALLDTAQRQRARSQSTIVFANVIGSLDADLLLLDGPEAHWFQDRPTALGRLADRIAQLAEST
jgi:phosphopantothenoylcysteine decarboxylase/phosphopantothenate--cysteine ligase